MKKDNGISSYLLPQRLADVLALIQVLAYDRDTSRSEEGLKDEFQRAPSTTGSWIELGRQHPEFFRVRNEENKIPRVALISRYVLPHDAVIGGKEDKRPQLEPEVTNKLMEFAMQLHDRQLERKNRWKTLLPVIVAIIAAAASISAAVITVSKPTPAGLTTPMHSNPQAVPAKAVTTETFEQRKK